MYYVRKEGVEPSRLSAPEFESGVATDYTTRGRLNLCDLDLIR